MPLKFYNYLTRNVGEFKPIGETVGLYTCGPTVYDYVHIGNWRTFVFEDVLKRVLKFNGHNVKHVMNLTDIDDKIIKKSSDQGIGYRELTDKYADAFFADLKKLNIIPADVFPRATDKKYMGKMIDLISKLLEKGAAYKGDDGIYFSVEKFKDYGKLSGLDKKNLKKGARVSSDEYDKESWTDFALWKFPPSHKATEDKYAKEPSWQAPFGEGRPGWHIECSAMSIEELGESFDIHTGGVDLLFPHHENEIAQSEAASGQKFVNVWMEGEHLLVDGAKMAKRDKNIFTIRDIVEKGFDPLALRYLFLTAHYRSKLNFTWESLEAAQKSLVFLWRQAEVFGAYSQTSSDDREPSDKIKQRFDEFINAVNDDLDMPGAIATVHKAIGDISGVPGEAETDFDTLFILDKVDSVLGLSLREIGSRRWELIWENRAEKEELLKKRESLRKAGKFEEADAVRVQIDKMGLKIEDTPKGPVLRLKEND